jgi:hypothetical protein
MDQPNPMQEQNNPMQNQNPSMSVPPMPPAESKEKFNLTIWIPIIVVVLILIVFGGFYWYVTRDRMIGPGLPPGEEISLNELKKLNIQITGNLSQSEQTLPSSLTGPDWSIKKDVCEQGGYNLSDFTGKSVFFNTWLTDEIYSQGSQPISVWVITYGNNIACVYKTVKDAVPGVISINDQQYTIEASVTPDLTADWKTYTDSQLGYEFKYPIGWKLDTNTYTESSGLKRQISTTEVVPPNMEPAQEAFIVTQNYSTLSDIQSANPSGTQISISGKVAYKYSTQRNPSDSLIFIAPPGLLLSLHSPDSEMDQILSTFRFTK